MKAAWLAILALVPFAAAHPYEERGNITLGLLGFETLILPLVPEVAPAALPNGVLAWRVAGVMGGDEFTVVADDGQNCHPIGLGNECCQDGLPADFDNGTPAEGTPLDKWVDPPIWAAGDPTNRSPVCSAHPDFDVYFSAGGASTSYGDEWGIVPGDGDALVTLFFGDIGEGFTYSEA